MDQLSFSHRANDLYGDDRRDKLSIHHSLRVHSSAPPYSPPRNRNVPKHVSFIVQDMVSSPTIQRAPPRAAFSNSFVTTSSQQLNTSSSSSPPRIRAEDQPIVLQPRQVARKSVTQKQKPKKTKEVMIKKNVTENRPSWDSNTVNTIKVFDPTLSKLDIFRPKAEKTTTTQSQNMDPNATKHRITPSKIGLSFRPKKDFIRLNYEQITKRPYKKDLLSKKRQLSGAARPKSPSVVERLSSRLNTPWAQTANNTPISAPIERDSGTIQLNSKASPTPSSIRSSPHTPILTIQPYDAVSVPSRSPPSSSSFRPSSASSWRSGNGAQSSAPRQSRSPESSPTNSRNSIANKMRSNNRKSSTRSPSSSPTQASSVDNGINRRRRNHYNHITKVFERIDRTHQNRIDSHQIVEGLRMLGLDSTTYDQVTEYIYLIHDGESKYLNAEEFEILVNSLHAANGVEEYDAGLAPPRSPFVLSPSGQSSPTGLFDLRPPTLVSGYTSNRSASVENDDDAIIRHQVDGVLTQANAIGLQNFNNDLGEFSNPEKFLHRAVSVVQGLKSSLFPLVHQAEEILKAVRKRHGTKQLSLFLTPSELSKIAENSDILATCILDDLLLDTVEILNEEEKRHSKRKVHVGQIRQLDDIMHFLTQVEQQEEKILRSTSVLPHQASSPEQPNLVLPLEVVMNIEVSEKTCTSPHQTSTTEADMRSINTADAPPPGSEDQSIALISTENSSSMVMSPIRTSILGDARSYERIEKARLKFLKHRRFVESSLTDTGLDQCSVIEM
jgi:hypothetical protein